ncbi:hypothetical protein [Microlunatus sp. GCM10028923]|uniref:hypothetical protein n=1 Tax=Microlunatus sp. GCM10028923 TaxID=3273400 RepID=UPI0036130971
MLNGLIELDPERPGIGLRLLGEDGPIWDGVVGDLLIMSTGRPWRRTRRGLTSAAVRDEGARVVITGRLEPIAVEIVLRSIGGRLAVELRWTNDGPDPVDDLVVGVQWPAGPPNSRITIPQVIQHDNPSADPDRTVPHVSRGGYVTGVDRLPIPAVCVEPSDGRYLMIIDEPDAEQDPDGRVSYGTLGAVAGTEPAAIIALSGSIMFDGVPDLDYVHKSTTAANPRGYRTLAPGGTITRKLLVEGGELPRPGRGFVALARAGRSLGPAPEAEPAGRGTMIDLKAAALDARAFSDGPVAGYLKFPAWGEPRNERPGGKRRPAHDFSYGWTGQCLRLAWCDAALGLRDARPDRLERARRVIDFYLDGSAAPAAGLRYTGYVHDDRAWIGAHRRGTELIFARAHGESLCDIADTVRLLADHGLEAPASWTEAVITGAEFVAGSLAHGLVPLGWTPEGVPVSAEPCAAGIPAAQAVAAAYRLSGRGEFLELARDLGERYQALPGPSFERPYSHSTLDAACEDKEAGLYLLRFWLELFDLTGDRSYLSRGEEVAEWLLTWVYHWSPRFDSGSMLDQRGFTALGWPGVSVQNHHLDVFFPTYELWRLGRLTGHDHFRVWAEGIDTALRQGICERPGDWGFDVVGEQGEAFFVTDWQQRGAGNTWNPSWVIALPLWNALLLEREAAVSADP